MNLDMRTNALLGVVLNFLCTLVIAGLWRQNRKSFEGTGYWFIEYCLFFLGTLLIALRGAIPDWISIVVANTLIAFGVFSGLFGLERFVDKRGRHLHNYALLVAFPFLYSYYTFLQPNLAARNLILWLTLLFVSLQSALLLLHRADPALRHFTRWTGLVILTFCALFLTRIVWTILHPDPNIDYFRSGTIGVVFQMAFQVALVALTFSLALMVNKRLLLANRSQEEKFSAAFHSAPYAIILTRLADGKVFEVNRGFERITGYGHSEVVGTTTAALRLWVHPEDREGVVGKLQQGTPVRDQELQFRKKDGSLITGLFSAAALRVGKERCLLLSFADLTDRIHAEQERERLVAEREKALSEVKVLSGMLPICASCKKIRDDKGYWRQIETYIRTHSEAVFSHGICPDCMEKLYPGLVDE